MVFHGLVKVHALQDWRVEAREQLRGDDYELERVELVAEAVHGLLE